MSVKRPFSLRPKITKTAMSHRQLPFNSLPEADQNLAESSPDYELTIALDIIGLVIDVNMGQRIMFKFC